MSNERMPIDRETLYNEVWAEPVSVVALRYGLSDVGLAKICRKLAIPLPSRGYWAKVKAGRIMAKASLPKLKESLPQTTRLLKLDPEQVASLEQTKKVDSENRKKAELSLIEHASGPRLPLIVATSKRLRQREGWEKGRLSRSAPKEVLNITVTMAELDRALDIADAVLKTLAKQGFDFEVRADSGTTVIHQIETGVHLELAISEHIRRSKHEPTAAEEKARKVYWSRSRFDASASYPHIPQYDYNPTGVLTLEVGRWPSKSWKDTPKTKLEQRLGEIISGVFALAKQTHDKMVAEARRQDAQRKAVELYEYFSQRRAAEIARFSQLEASAANWERATKIRAYAVAVEEKAKAAGELSEAEIDWLAWARAKADSVDAIIQVSDPILDAPEKKKPITW